MTYKLCLTAGIPGNLVSQCQNVKPLCILMQQEVVEGGGGANKN